MNDIKLLFKGINWLKLYAVVLTLGFLVLLWVHLKHKCPEPDYEALYTEHTRIVDSLDNQNKIYEINRIKDSITLWKSIHDRPYRDSLRNLYNPAR